MRTALAFWRRSQVSASTSARVHYRPDEINWMHVVLKFGLGLLLLGIRGDRRTGELPAATRRARSQASQSAASGIPRRKEEN